VLTDLRLSLSVLRLPVSWAVLLASIVATGLVFAVLGGFVWWAILQSNIVDTVWLEKIIGGFGVGMAAILGWFCFPAFITALVGLFSDPLAGRIEKQHYPFLPAPTPAPLPDQIRNSIKAIGKAVALNLLAFPFYFIPVVNILAYALVNAQLLGREYFFNFALRHMPLEKAQAVYAEHHWAVTKTGLLIAGLFILPGINLFAPILATSLTIHRLLRGKAAPLSQMLALAP
jgi:uncharacterized protein involved in cysteine biosynthesis